MAPAAFYGARLLEAREARGYTLEQVADHLGITKQAVSLYEKAMRGEIDNLTGVNDPYEEPDDADLVLDTENESPEQSADRLMEVLAEKGLLG